MAFGKLLLTGIIKIIFLQTTIGANIRLLIAIKDSKINLVIAINRLRIFSREKVKKVTFDNGNKRAQSAKKNVINRTLGIMVI